MVNLISNAIKYTDVNGEILIKVKKLNKKLIQVSISDTGKGINPEDIKKIFEFHKHLDADNHHKAVGLAITKEIIEQHGGQIKVESEPDKGSRFVFSLPQEQRHTERRTLTKRREKERRFNP